MMVNNDNERHYCLLRQIGEIQPELTLEMNDIGMCQTFINLYSARLKYNDTRKSWMVYNGIRWVLDPGAKKVNEFIIELYTLLKIYAARIENKYSDTYMKFILTYSNRHKREILMRDIQAALTVQQDDFDKHDNLFNCQNGTLNLDTFEFYNHNSEDMLTQVSNCDYNPDANNTMFMNFLDEVMVGDKELVKYLLRIFGYWITSDTSLETAFFNIGKTTRNGKTTCTETFGAMMGSYAKVIPPSALAMTKYDNGSSPNPFLADLQGVRLLLTSEPPKGMRLNEALFKRLTGGDLLTVRGLYEKPYSFLPQFKICMNCNSTPVVADDSVFVSDRIRAIPFDRHFEPDEQDRSLKKRLKEPEILSSVLNCALIGLKDLRENGEQIPDRVIETIDNYRFMSDKIQRFFDNCMVDDGGISLGADVFKAYCNWCTANAYPLEGKQEFFSTLRERGLLQSSTIKSKTIRNTVRYSILQQ